MEIANRHVLVLNKHWLAVHICTVRRAMALLYQGVAHVVADDYQTYDFETWLLLSNGKTNGHRVSNGDGLNGYVQDLMIRTPRFQLRIPQVIVLARYQRNPPRTVRFNRRNIYIRDRYQCQYCGASPDRENLTIDHVSPRSRGGRSVWENVVTACAACNAKKGDRLPAECGMHPRTPPRCPSWLATLRSVRNEEERLVWKQFIETRHWQSYGG
jgi:5-methylcytosine-specific restriction endonuclease McrA